MLLVEVLSASVPVASFVAAPWAVLVTVPHVAGVVGEVTCTLLFAPGAISPKEQVSTAELMEHWVASVPASIVQLKPALAGRVSERVTLRAIPAPVLVSTILKPTWSFALTGLASAILL